MTRTYETIVLHCSATPPRLEIDTAIIDKWHRGRGWAQVGYHYVIKRDGTVEIARPVQIPGAHAKGHNAYTVGVCYVGGVNEDNNPEDNITPKQVKAFKKLVGHLRAVFGPMLVTGHCDLPNVAKACPSFDVRKKLGAKFCDGGS